MENSFKKLGKPIQEVPQEIKNNVKKEIALRLLVSDVTNLFTKNYGEVAKSFIEKKPLTKNPNYGEN